MSTKLGIHGTRYTFDVGKCRCEACVLANRTYMREYYQRPTIRERFLERRRRDYARKHRGCK
jgi:hypothetical protein